MNDKPMTGETIKFRRWYDQRAKTGVVVGELPNGSLKVRTMRLSAHGNDWVPLIVPVKQSEIIV